VTETSALRDPRALSNLVLIEIGNSHVTQAVSQPDRAVADVRRFALDALAEWPAAFHEAWDHLPAGRLRHVVIASVVPALTARFHHDLEMEDIDAIVIGDDLPAATDNQADDPQSVGIDRLCGAAAAYDTIKAACAVASFGTATTIDCVDDEGRFRGGAILPGLGLQAWSLAQRTARLPEVDIREPTSVYGGDTEHAILNGIVYGAVGALREIVERYATELGRWPQLVVTGGYATIIRHNCDFIDSVVPDLVLRGMAISYRAFYAEADEETDASGP